MTIDARYTPHGHTASNCKPEPRCVCKVKIRDDQMSQILPDGRAYGPGTHTIQVYISDMANLNSLLETRPEDLALARRICEEKTLEFIESNRKAHADVDPAEADRLSRKEAPYNVPAEFRAIVRVRDLLPVESFSILETLPPIGDAVEFEREARAAAAATAQTEALGRVIAQNMRGAEPTQQNKGR